MGPAGRDPNVPPASAILLSRRALVASCLPPSAFGAAQHSSALMLSKVKEETTFKTELQTSLDYLNI